ncbi:membrane fusion protein, multidrug efflux system [Tranquillimonas rosea]|uniref:Membrane fusion protein, multidrug efflux system n=1 Tax=Tranquillimonas rosea TaxID=641238 RepID=A0A1H9RKS6_9RHOB|nr:efflux RND transporter periplasmic adaptor subunit [Tranquillimonas rosea]SER73461.1 membrane fusion protein, multidrug efflux system [Tranquillimonas rosea]
MPENDEPERQPLSFTDDRGASRAAWIALALVVLLTGWMASGLVFPSGPEPTSEPVAEQADDPIAVAVRPSEAESVAQYFVAEGQAQPDRETTIRAEISGEVAEVLVDKGAMVEERAIIARLSRASAEANLRQAEEELSRAQREFDNASALLERGTSTVDRVAEARTALSAAEAGVTSAQEALNDTEIRAPFAGRVEELPIDPGEFVQAGGEVGRILDTQPLTVTLQVPQQTIGRLDVGQTAEVTFITGESREGEITFLGSSADPETRTFLAEITVPNEGGTIPSGVSAEVRVATGEVVAHFLSPAILSLGPEGQLGVKTVDEEDRVVFHEVEIVRAQTDGIWVRGLPDSARIITVGQGFVSAGEEVAPKVEDMFGAQVAQGEQP